MNINLLKSKMALYGDSQRDLAEAMGILRGSLNLKMNLKREFKLSDLEAIVKRYNLTPDEIKQIFFNEDVIVDEQNLSGSGC